MTPCILLTHIGCYDLPKVHFLSTLKVTFYWMATIRLIHFTILAPNKVQTLYIFIFKVLWILFPLVPSNSVENQWSILFDIISVALKITVNHWLYDWLMKCESNDSYMRIIMFYFGLLTTSYITDMQIVVVRLLTRDKYTFQSFTNFPLFARSLRDFWGRRYNRLVGTVLKESLFQPLHLFIPSSALWSLLTFIVSGVLHVHIALIVFNDNSFLLSTFAFFLLQGSVCCLEAFTNIRFPQPYASLITHLFLLLTSPMLIELYARETTYFPVNIPPFYGSQWIPKFSTPSFCPK